MPAPFRWIWLRARASVAENTVPVELPAHLLKPRTPLHHAVPYSRVVDRHRRPAHVTAALCERPLRAALDAPACVTTPARTGLVLPNRPRAVLITYSAGGVDGCVAALDLCRRAAAAVNPQARAGRQPRAVGSFCGVATAVCLRSGCN